MAGYSGYNYASSGIQGAGQGAAAGAAFGPLGAAIGGGVGLVAGLFQAAAEEEDYERRMEILDQIQQYTNESYNDIEHAFTEYYDAYNMAKAYGYKDENGNLDLSKFSDVSDTIADWDNNLGKRMEEVGLWEYDSATKSYKPKDMQFKYTKTVKDKDGKEIEVNKDVTDFLNPYMGNVINASNASVQHSAAGAGLGRSTGAAKAIAENTAKEYDKLYNTALNAYNTDRAQAYTEYQGYLDNANKMLGTLLESDKWKLGQQQALNQDVLDWENQQMDNKIGLEKDRINTRTQIDLSRL